MICLMRRFPVVALASSLAFTMVATRVEAQESRYGDLANVPFVNGYIPKDNVPELVENLFFQRAVQTYLWALPALNMYGMKEGSEKVFGKGYNVLPIWKQRLNATWSRRRTPTSSMPWAISI